MQDDVFDDDLHSEIEETFGGLEGADESGVPDSGDFVEPVVFLCGFCGSENHTFADPSQGNHQEYVEDCQTCCRPNVLRVYREAASGTWQIHAELE
ncbi:MAG: CPXCG motif-containing cysteine-rich protein [Cyclonatronaceae bacterium]